MSSGNKYHRFIYDLTSGVRVTVDVYAVIEAFAVTCPARQHAIKKLLCAGLRGKGDAVQDLTEARDALTRAVGLEGTRAWHAEQHDAEVRERITKAETKVPVGVRRGSAFLTQGDNLPRLPDIPPGVDPVWDDAKKGWVVPDQLPVKGTLSVKRIGNTIHTICTTCHKHVAYYPDNPRPALCRACVPATEPEAGPPS